VDLRSVVRTSVAGSRQKRLLVNLGVGAIVVVALMVSIVSLALAVTTSFPDVPANHPYYTAVNDLATRGIIGGYENGNFGPSDVVTRQQFAKMIVKTMGYNVPPAMVCPFADLDPTPNPHDPLYPAKYVAVCASYGVTTGYPDGTFKPSDNITRQQLITMVVRAAALSAPPADYAPAFTPAQFSLNEHYLNAKKAAYAGLLAGLQGVDTTYNFLASSTRGEVAQVLHNLLTILTPVTTTTGSNSTTTTTAVTTTTTSSSTTTTSSSTTTTTSGGLIARYSGSGDDVIDVQKPAGPALVWVEGNAGSRHFAVVSYGPGYSGQYTYYDLLVNTTDPYEGLHLIDYWYFGQEELTTRLEVTATGAWSIEIRPLSSARTVGTPGQVQGTKDDVIRVTGNPSKAHIVGNAGSRYFGVWAYYGRSTMYDLLANETDPYDGTVMFSKPNAYLIEVHASGPWSINTQP
jgi:hypothetical protein